jgi:AbrB family looped-hinge helix DNA binding protein
LSKEYNRTMPTATVTSKGQVTIPVEVRERLGIEAGTRVQFVASGDGSWQFVVAGGSVRDLHGMFGPRASAVTEEDMRDAGADAATDRFSNA